MSFASPLWLLLLGLIPLIVILHALSVRWRNTPVMMLSSADVSYGLSIKSFLTDGECLPAEDFVDKIQAPEEIVMRARRMVERLNDPG